MRNVKLDNSDILAYFDTIEKLKKQPSMDEYLEGYRKVREEYPFGTQVDKYRSAYNELRRLDKKRQSFMGNFIGGLNPISFSTANTSTKSSGDLDKFYERSLYRKAIQEKSDEGIIALVIKQRTKAALEFQRSVEQSLEQLSSISSDFGKLNQKRRKMAI